MDWVSRLHEHLEPTSPSCSTCLSEPPGTLPLLLQSGSETILHLLEVKTQAGESRNVPRARTRHGERVRAWSLLLISSVAVGAVELHMGFQRGVPSFVPVY